MSVTGSRRGLPPPRYASPATVGKGRTVDGGEARVHDAAALATADNTPGTIDRWLAAATRFAHRKPWVVLAIAAMVLASSWGAASRLTIRLLWADNLALQSFGKYAVAGEIACIVTGLVVLPAALSLRKRMKAA